MAEKEKRKNTRIAAIGDLHVHDTPSPAHREMFSRASSEADVLLLCGDLTNSGSLPEAELLAADLKSLKIPVFAVLGNHDHHGGKPQEIKRILHAAGLVFLDDEPVECRGIGFGGVKGFCGGFDKRMLGSYGEEAIKHFVSEVINEALALENSLKKLEAKQIVIVLHYAPVQETLKGEPEQIFPFLGCSRLAEVIDRYSVTAVFHGHAHHGTHEGKTPKGTPVYNCSMEVLRKLDPARPYALVEL